MSKKFLFFSPAGELDELTCLVCAVDENEKRERSAPSNFHHRILKCRLLIFSAGEVLASPDPKSERLVFVIFNRQITDNVKFLDHVDKINLKVVKTIPVDLETYETCFKYTLIAKMAPSWNHVQTNILVKGRDFLHYSVPQNAVVINVFAFENAIVLEVECIKIHLSPIKVKDLDVTQENLNLFNNTPCSNLSEYAVLNQWIHVLPSLKKGRIISINRNIPKSSLFSNYKDLRRHWKNIYGYRLPEDDAGILYYEIHFKPLGPQLYTYPSICLLKNYPTQITPCPDNVNEISKDFTKDANKCLTHLLGCSLHFDLLDIEKSHELFTNSSWNTLNILKFNKLLESNRINMINETVESERIDLEPAKFGENFACNTYFTQNLSLSTPTQNIIIDKYKPTFGCKKHIEINISNNSHHGNEFSDVNNKKNNFSNNTKGVIKNTPQHELNPSYLSSNKNSILLSTNDNRKRNCDTLMENYQNPFSSLQNNSIHVNNEKIKKQKVTINGNDIFNTNVNNADIDKNKQEFSNINLTQEYNKNINRDYIDTPLYESLNGNCVANSEIHNFGKTQQKLNILENVKSKQHISNNKPPKSTAKNENIDSKSTSSNIEIDIPMMAKTNFEVLKKITVRVLYLWLQSQNVHVTTKMVKQQLLDKVRDHLKL